MRIWNSCFEFLEKKITEGLYCKIFIDPLLICILVFPYLKTDYWIVEKWKRGRREGPGGVYRIKSKIWSTENKSVLIYVCIKHRELGLKKIMNRQKLSKMLRIKRWSGTPIQALRHVNSMYYVFRVFY